MEIEKFTDAISVILAVEQPWLLTKIEAQRKNKVVDVYIDYAKGSKFCCSQCGDICSVHDSIIRRIRHLDLFEYQHAFKSRQEPI